MSFLVSRNELHELFVLEIALGDAGLLESVPLEVCLGGVTEHAIGPSIAALLGSIPTRQHTESSRLGPRGVRRRSRRAGGGRHVFTSNAITKCRFESVVSV